MGLLPVAPRGGAAARVRAPSPTLRLDRNRNKLTRAEQARERTLRIGVVGLSAGHSIAHVLAMEGLAGEIRLADFDTLELSNLNRIPASVLDLGVNKAVVAARRIAEIDPYLRVVVEPEGVTRENLGAFLDGLDVVIEECDSLDMKFLVREAARDRRIPVIMETSDRGVLDVERFDLEPDRPIFHGLLGRHGLDEAGRTHPRPEGPLRDPPDRPTRGVLARGGVAARGRPDDHRMAPARQRGHPRRRDGGRRRASDRPGRGTAVGSRALRRRGDPLGPRAGRGRPRGRGRPLHAAARGPAAR